MADRRDHPDTEPTAPTPAAAGRPPTGRLAAAGLASALAALGAGELVSSLSGTGQSLVAGVGTAFIDRFAGSLKDLAVSVFGTGDKAALLVGIVVVAAALGAALGVANGRRPWAGPAGFVAAGAVGALAGVADPQANGALAVAAATAAAATGAGALAGLTRLAAAGTGTAGTTDAPARGGLDVGGAGTAGGGVTEHPTDPAASRRAFVGWAGGVGALALAAAGAARVLGNRSIGEQSRAGVRLPSPPDTAGRAGEPLGVAGLTPYYVPNGDFYLIDTALVKPQIDHTTWRLRIGGMVERPYEVSFADLLAMPQVEEAVTLSCVSNEVGGDLVGNARWQGVRLADLLDRAGVNDGASQIVGISTDGFTAGFPTEVGLDGRVAMVAVGMNGEPLPVAHGFPARLVVAGLYGYVSATKWLQEIRLTTLDGFDGYWIDKGWAKQAPVKTQSRIDVPRAYAELASGPTRVAGVAWAPATGISAVEVQVDDGPWQPARLGEVVSRNTWVQWVLDWDAQPGDHRLRCRATDTTGATQIPQRSRPDPDGATGWHSVNVTVR